ncbi:MAG TPA: RidA family protein [Mycobacteriales bacterium]|nr:RidA family protein [Mycobacteriales bacterium]
MTAISCWTFGPSVGVPEPVAPYSHAAAYGDLLHVTGQMPIDPATGGLAPGGVAAQTDAVLANLQRVLELCGSSLDAVVSVRAYLVSFDDYEEFNATYERWFAPPLPARTCIGVTGLAVGALVEIDLVAALGSAGVRRMLVE